MAKDPKKQLGSPKRPVSNNPGGDPNQPEFGFTRRNVDPGQGTYDPETGEFKGNDPTSVSERVTGLMSRQSPLMKGARTRGKQAANRRGLMNTSMGVRAGESAAFEQAVPIASQEAQQSHQSQIARMNVAADERKQAANLAASFENSYSAMISNIMNNPELPSKARKKYSRHAAQVRDSNLALVEQMYGIELEWSTPQGAGSGGRGQQTVDEINQQAGRISSLRKKTGNLQDEMEKLRDQLDVLRSFGSPNRMAGGGGAGGPGGAAGAGPGAAGGGPGGPGR